MVGVDSAVRYLSGGQKSDLRALGPETGLCPANETHRLVDSEPRLDLSVYVCKVPMQRYVGA